MEVYSSESGYAPVTEDERMHLQKQIELHASSAGISSEEVRYARELSANKKCSAPVDHADRLFLCEGLWAAEKLYKKSIPVRYFLFCPEYIKKSGDAEAVCRMLQYADDSYVISEKACRRISERDGADGFFIVAEMPKISLSELSLSGQMVAVICDGQEQPGNLGAILRSLDGAGGSFAVLVNQRIRLTNSRLIRSSLGAAFTMPVAESSMDELCVWLKQHEFRVILTDLSAEIPYYEADFNGRIAIVAGNEFNGISPEWRRQSNAVPVIIPMLGECESLNVGFAATLVAYEASLRQKGLRK